MGNEPVTVDVEKGDPVGKCPDCGYVAGGDVDNCFPSPATCNLCVSVLDKMVIANHSQTLKP